MGSSTSLHSKEYTRFRGRLREMREAAGLTQRAMGEKLGVPHSYVHKCEVGERRIDPLELIRWCWACGQAPEEFVGDLAKTLKKTRRSKQ